MPTQRSIPDTSAQPCPGCARAAGAGWAGGSPAAPPPAVPRRRGGRGGGVGGRKDGPGTPPAGRAIAAALGSRFGVGGSLYHHGRAAQEVDHIPFGAYPTDLVRRLQGWDERLEANEDFEFDYRLRSCGATLLFDPALQIS